MPDEQRVFEIEIKIRSATDETVRHLEGPLPHATAEDVAVDLVGTLSSRSKGIKHIPHTDR